MYISSYTTQGLKFEYNAIINDSLTHLMLLFFLYLLKTLKNLNERYSVSRKKK